MANKTISWSKISLNQFNEAINHIKANSVQNAENVRVQLLNKIGQLVKFPDIYPKDKYKTKNDGSYRSFELYHYRVTYRIIKSGIKIIRVRHTSMMPKIH